MSNKLIFTFAIGSALAAFAASNTYKVSILNDTTVEGKQVKAGDYKLELAKDTATLKHGKDVIEVPAHTEQAQSKYGSTQMQFVDNKLHEIHIGGTSTKVVFGGENAASTGGSN